MKCANCGEQHQVQDWRCGAKRQAMRIARGYGQPGWRPTQETHKQMPLTGAPEAADWSEIEEEIVAATNATAVNAAAANTATANATAENAAAANVETENSTAESDTEISTSGIAPPMTA
jgi:hypothetical protein